MTSVPDGTSAPPVGSPSPDDTRTRFEALVLPHVRYLYRLAVKLTGRPADAEDLERRARISRERITCLGVGGSGLDLIAEPWAIGGNSYQVGGFPSGWIE